MSASNFCCTHPQQRIDSPELPARQLAAIDSIFAAAALPEDHPHALKFPARKSELHPSIMRSPNMATKIKLQFWRKSMKSLGREKDYDEDAHRMSSQEVLKDLEEVPSEDEVEWGGSQRHRFGSTLDLGEDEPQIRNPAGPYARSSFLRSLEYLRPLIQRPSELTTSGELYNLVDVATRVATRQALADVSNQNDCPLSPIPKSFSTPMLMQEELIAPVRPRRSRSEDDLGDTPIMPKLRGSARSDGHFVSSDLREPSGDFSPVPGSPLIDNPTLHVQEATSIDSTVPQEHSDGRDPNSADEKAKSSSSETRVPLHKMDISQQLRCMSQLSDVAEDVIKTASHQPWNFHLRERSDLGPDSGRSRHSRQKSSSGIDSSTVPSAWGRVRSPIRDTASSLYSRPTSAGTNAIDANTQGANVTHSEPPVDLDALFADWPLKPSLSADEIRESLRTPSERSAGSERRNKPLPPTPERSRKDSDTASLMTANNKDEHASVKFLSLPQRAGSVPSKSSSSMLSQVSKASRFMERFSPPKRLVRKRRSIFKFLRPGSRKQQGRSVSTPVLGTKSPKAAGTYDGPSDDPALLLVQYELPEQSDNTTRSMSVVHLGPGQHVDTTGELAPPHTLQRRPTLADYERKLSVIGDDRRRPSAVNLPKMKEIQEEDRRESMGVKRRLSRARALKDDASPLMAQALEKHQQEKALFRSASKQRESVKSSHPTPTTYGSPSVAGAETGSTPTIPDDHSDLLDPLEKGHLRGHSGRSFSVAHLAPPGVSTAGPSHRESIAAASKATSTNASSTEHTLTQRNRIGTSLESWSRYPSHTRSERCGSAGHADAVITRDFAVDVNPEDIHFKEETEVPSPASKKSGKSVGKRSKISLPKSRSMTFSGIVRYYSNLFHTSGFAGQNRRTSITTGGRLEYPELEMLPPQLPTDIPPHPRHSYGHQLEHLKEHVKEDADKINQYVRDEEGKIEIYMKREEDELETFVRKEEDKLECFVGKEEGKLKSYIKEEEDKLMHPRRHGSSEHHSASDESPFREISVFGISRDRGQEQYKRRDTMIGPMDDLEERPSQVQSDGSTDRQLHLDGAASTQPTFKSGSQSKAKVWSNVYKECLAQKGTGVEGVSVVAGALEQDEQSKKMSPPSLKPAKPRSPEHTKQLDPKSVIRRFPSVTVIDDRKGHVRSISLISVKTSRSTTFERSSTYDLLELIQAREKEEREKLLRGAESGNAVATIV